MTTGLGATTLANKWLDMLSGTAFTAPVGAYVKLHTGDPGAAGATAAAAGDATRKAITYAAAANGVKALNGTKPVWTNAASTETITHLSVWDASTAGNFELSTQLTAPQPWLGTNTFTLDTLSISFAPIAA